MFSKAFAYDILKLLLHGTPIPGFADFPAAGAVQNLYIGLHTADPGPDGTQETNACTYTGYGRRGMGIGDAVGVSNWNITGDKASPAMRVEFPEMTGGVEQLATWITIGTSYTGPGRVLFRGKLNPSIQCRVGVIPAIKQDASITLISASPAP